MEPLKQHPLISFILTILALFILILTLPMPYYQTEMIVCKPDQLDCPKEGWNFHKPLYVQITDSLLQKDQASDEALATSFEECVKLEGSTLQESYPMTCITPDGESFTQPTPSPKPTLDTSNYPHLDFTTSSSIPSDWQIYATPPFTVKYPKGRQVYNNADSEEDYEFALCPIEHCQDSELSIFPLMKYDSVTEWLANYMKRNKSEKEIYSFNFKEFEGIAIVNPPRYSIKVPYITAAIKVDRKLYEISYTPSNPTHQQIISSLNFSTDSPKPEPLPSEGSSGFESTEPLPSSGSAEPIPYL